MQHRSRSRSNYPPTYIDLTLPVSTPWSLNPPIHPPKPTLCTPKPTNLHPLDGGFQTTQPPGSLFCSEGLNWADWTTVLQMAAAPLCDVTWNPWIASMRQRGSKYGWLTRNWLDVSTRCRDPEAHMFRNTAPKCDLKHPCHVTKAIRSIGACHKCFETCIPADSVFDWQGRKQITQLHICLNLTPTKYKSGVNASSLRGFLWEDFFKGWRNSM